MVNAIIQARTGSKRLPGKVLKKVLGRPLIDYLLESVRRAMLVEKIVIAIPEGDIELKEHLEGWNVVEGPEEDVASRFVKALEEYPCDGFVRICADSPLLDRAIIDWAIDRFSDHKRAKVSGIVRTVGFPKGQQVEVIDTEMFLGVEPLMTEREHVTQYFYTGDYPVGEIHNLYPKGPDMVVDTMRDFMRVRACINTVREPWKYSFTELQEYL